jgi:hypothetical protein
LCSQPVFLSTVCSSSTAPPDLFFNTEGERILALVGRAGRDVGAPDPLLNSAAAAGFSAADLIK